MTALRKSTSFDWGNEFNEWYIIPAITVSFNYGFSITIAWLKIYYSHTWRVITYEEEDEWASIHYKLKDKQNESSSV